MEKTSFHITANADELTIREGSAPDVSNTMRTRPTVSLSWCWQKLFEKTASFSAMRRASTPSWTTMCRTGSKIP